MSETEHLVVHTHTPHYHIRHLINYLKFFPAQFRELSIHQLIKTSHHILFQKPANPVSFPLTTNS